MSTNMKTTPQPNLTQPKLTSMLQSNPQIPTVQMGTGDNTGQGLVTGQGAAAPAPVALGTPGEPLTADFFRQLIGENTAAISVKIDNVTGDLAALAKTVEASKSELAAVTGELGCQASDISEHKSQLEALTERIARLENKPNNTTITSTTRSAAYLKSRRSVRMWPIENASEETLWKGVGEFLHSALGIPDSDVGPEDIESVVSLPEPRYAAGNLNKEALVTFFCPRQRDLVVASSPNLSNLMDNGVPTAGLRLEIPDELMGQFRRKGTSSLMTWKESCT